MKIQLSDHFTYRKLLTFVFPSIIMMIFTSIYGVVDGLFVSNYVGKTPFAAVNMIMPYLMMMAALGFMFGTGGSAIVAKTFGEKKNKQANEIFSMIVYVVIASGLIITVISQILLPSISKALGAEGAMLENCILYGRITLMALPAFMLQNVFQSFLVTAEKPGLGLGITIGAGVTNMILDFVFIAVFKWGLAGAALATAISQLVGGIVPLIYFARKNSSLLKLTKAKISAKIIGKTCINGSSEFMTNISMSVVNMLYNLQLMKFIGEDGIAAYGVIMYVNFIFIAIFIGYSIGSAPVIGYHYGADNENELKSLLKKSVVLISISNVVLTILAWILANPLSKIFVGYDVALHELTVHAFQVFSLSFLVIGFNIFGSAFFTALGNGAISALISFLRTLLFQIVAVMLLPVIFGVDGIWIAITVAEVLAVIVTIICIIGCRKKYKYL